MITAIRVFTETDGVVSLERGLVDHLGGLQQAVASAARRAGLGDGYRVEYIEADLTMFEQFMIDLTASAMVALDVKIPAALQLLNSSLVQRTLEELAFISGPDEGFTRYAHCLCNVF